MAIRKPLTVAITPENTDPETVRSFITQERIRPQVGDFGNSSKMDEDLPANTADEEHSMPVPKKRGKGKLPVGLIPITVRLSPELAHALKRASLERELAGEEPCSQQDIVAQALEPWLRMEGYLP